METKKATIRRDANNAYLVLDVTETPLEIILTDDIPNNVKSIFNKLLKELKVGVIEFELQDDNEDLYHHICTEYISQLNGEMKAIHQELDDYDLLEGVDN